MFLHGFCIVSEKFSFLRKVFQGSAGFLGFPVALFV